MAGDDVRRIGTLTRATLARFSPRRWRFQRLLRSLPLDLEAMGEELEPPGANDFIICGSPRTGTSLLTAALFQPPRVVTVMEPWDGMRLPPAELFRSLRAEIDTGTLGRGRLDVDALQREGRVVWRRDGEVRQRVQLDPEGLLGVKWPTFWQYLDRLPTTRFLVCVRDPFEVVASYGKAGGRVAEGKEYDTAFNRRLNEALDRATDDPSLRRVLLYEYVHERILPALGRPNVFVVRYERWFADPDALLADVGDFLGVRLDASPVQLRRPTPPSLTDEEEQLVRKTCRTAAALGYDLGAAPAVGERHR